MTDLSQRLRESLPLLECLISDRDMVSTDALVGGIHIATALMTEAADALDARDATHVDKADAWDAVTAKRPRWQTMESAPRDGTWFLAYEGGDVFKARWNLEGHYESACGQPVVYSPEPTHWQRLPNPPEGV